MLQVFPGHPLVVPELVLEFADVLSPYDLLAFQLLI